jgi:hypothetical protein
VTVTGVRGQQYRELLLARARDSWSPFLLEHSGLPGPRANLELVDAVADIGDLTVFKSLMDSDEEFLVLSGVVGLGQVLANGPNAKLERALRSYASDARWRSAKVWRWLCSGSVTRTRHDCDVSPPHGRPNPTH